MVRCVLKPSLHRILSFFSLTAFSVSGQVQVLTKEERLRFCKIIIALDDENHDELVKLMKEAGFQSKRMDPDVIWLYSKVNYDEDNMELTNGLHIQLVRS